MLSIGDGSPTVWRWKVLGALRYLYECNLDVAHICRGVNWSVFRALKSQLNLTYFPRRDCISSQGTSEALQFLHGCSSMTLHRIRRLLHVLQAFFARDRTLVATTGFVELVDIVSRSDVVNSISPEEFLQASPTSA